jgi:hypothetical protein
MFFLVVVLVFDLDLDELFKRVATWPFVVFLDSLSGFFSNNSTIHNQNIS